MKRSDAELGRLVRQAIKGLRVKRRRLYEPLRNVDPDDQYMEADRDFLLNNREVAVAVLTALAPPKHRRTS